MYNEGNDVSLLMSSKTEGEAHCTYRARIEKSIQGNFLEED
jgi:hypothetical protein